MGYVPQEHILFTGTVYEILLLPNRTRSRRKWKSGQKIASIHQDVLNFPDGYETIVGERGVALSGGQKTADFPGPGTDHRPGCPRFWMTLCQLWMHGRNTTS